MIKPSHPQPAEPAQASPDAPPSQPTGPSEGEPASRYQANARLIQCRLADEHRHPKSRHKWWKSR
jgi:hypothetical protein